MDAGKGLSKSESLCGMHAKAGANLGRNVARETTDRAFQLVHKGGGKKGSPEQTGWGCQQTRMLCHCDILARAPFQAPPPLLLAPGQNPPRSPWSPHRCPPALRPPAPASLPLSPPPRHSSPRPNPPPNPQTLAKPMQSVRHVLRFLHL